jgi:hypothetical protein
MAIAWKLKHFLMLKAENSQWIRLRLRKDETVQGS